MGLEIVVKVITLCDLTRVVKTETTEAIWQIGCHRQQTDSLSYISELLQNILYKLGSIRYCGIMLQKFKYVNHIEAIALLHLQNGG